MVFNGKQKKMLCEKQNRLSPICDHVVHNNLKPIQATLHIYEYTQCVISYDTYFS